jgi:trehalose 6-phosphate synthase/phosphatase
VKIFVSVHLPVKVSKNANGDWICTRSRHISTEALYAYRNRLQTRVIFLGSIAAPGATNADKAKIRDLLWENDCVAVFQDSIACFAKYLEFCQTFLWPVMNNQLPLQEDTEILMWDDSLWEAYKSANELYTTSILELITTLSSKHYKAVWVNDFHLFLVPSMLRRKLSAGSNRSSTQNLGSLLTGPKSSCVLSDVVIGMYIHTPFPTSEIFLTLPVRSEIMRGLLSVDLLGFQFYDYTRHFFSGAQKLFGVRATCQAGGLLALEVSEDRNVFIHITHNCIEPEYVIEEASSGRVQRKATALRDTHKNRVIIGSVDKLGRTSGILLKLRAFRLFLQQYSQYHSKVVFVLFVLMRGSQQTTPEHWAIADQARALVNEINTEFGPHVVFNDKLEDGDKAALLCVSDVLLETSLKDGLNLVPFEYLVARDTWLKLDDMLSEIASASTPPLPARRISTDPLSSLGSDEYEEFEPFGDSFGVHDCKKTGRIIISEFAGASQVLPGAQRVNPWHMDTILTALDETLSRPLAAAHAAFTRDVSYVSSRSQLKWAHEFATQMVTAAVAAARENQVTESTNTVESPRSVEPGASIYTHPSVSVPRLNREAVVNTFRKSNTRVLFLDNEGTLAPDLTRLYRHYGSISLANSTTDLQSRGCGPNAEVVSMLSVLAADPNTYVMILSGRSKEPLVKWFEGVVGVGFAAEHGFLWTHPRITNDSWRSIVSIDSLPADSLSWTQTTESIMSKYVNRTPNTYIEDKGSARVWQFRDAEAEFGIAQAKELHAELEIALREENLDITTGKGYVEVKLRGVNKGAAVAQFLEALAKEKNITPDFILCIGDDRSDEWMFQELLEDSHKSSVFTATVGRKKTNAKYYLSDVDHVSTLLASLAEEGLALDTSAGI